MSWFAVALGPPGDGFGIVPLEFGGLGGWSGADIFVVCGCVGCVVYAVDELAGRQAMSVFVQRLRSCAVLSIDSTDSTC